MSQIEDDDSAVYPGFIAECHNDRNYYKRGLCKTCYKKRDFPKDEGWEYLESLLEELEFIEMDWPDVERYTGRDRSVVAKYLSRKGHRDQVLKLHARTYGTTDRYEIMVLRKKEGI